MLESCPRCDYSLRGLPADHACPECGLRYDARSVISRAAMPKAAFLALLGFLYGGGVLFRIVFYGPVVPGAPCVIFFLLFLALVGGFGFTLWRLVTIDRRGQLVAALPDGLHLRLVQPADRVIPWDNITRVAVKPGKWRIGAVVFLKKERTVMDVTGVFKDRAAVERLVEAARSYLEGTTSYLVDRDEPTPLPTDDRKDPSGGFQER